MPELKALIFDLDDTLMDTFGQLIPEAHRQACLAMQAAGLDVEVDVLLKTRWELINEHPRKEINALLAEVFQCNEQSVIQAGINAYFNPQFEVLEPFSGVRQMLLDLGREYALFLLTSGVPAAQARKVKALNFAPYFKEVLYAPLNKERAKYAELQKLQSCYPFDYAEMVVIGDRITNEIVAGNQLGCFTIWIKQGECLGIVPEQPEEIPHQSTDNILDVPHLLTVIKDTLK